MKIVFQGDSITDMWRNRNEPNGGLGNGYVNLVTSMLSYEYPGKFEFINRGVGGSRSVDMYTRWKVDAINLKPDVLSILVGANDVLYDPPAQGGVEPDRFEMIYDMLLEYTREKLPETKLMVMEPFFTRGRNIEKAWHYHRSEIEQRAAIVRKLAERYGILFIPLQDAFDEVNAPGKGPAEQWTWEGIHPTPAGHMLIARRWIEGFKKLCDL